MMKKDRQQLECDIYFAYSNLDEIFAVLQLLENYIKTQEDTELNKWTMCKAIGSLKSSIIDVQVNLETAIEDKTKKEDDDDGRC